MKLYSRYSALAGLVGALLFAFGMSQTANAQMFVEPGITYEQGKADFNSNSGIVSFGGDLKGLGVSLKAGAHVNDIFFVGADVHYAEPEYTSSLFNTKTRSLLGGLVAGLQTPYAGVRVWGTYYPLGMWDQNRSEGLQMKLSEPAMFKLGAGLRVSSVSINLEYLNGKYNKSEVQNDGSGSVAQFTSTDAKRETWMLGVSFPFAL